MGVDDANHVAIRPIEVATFVLSVFLEPPIEASVGTERYLPRKRLRHPCLQVAGEKFANPRELLSATWPCSEERSYSFVAYFCKPVNSIVLGTFTILYAGGRKRLGVVAPFYHLDRAQCPAYCG